MIKLQESQIAQILPEYLSRRESVRALSYALHMAVQRLIGYCGHIGVFSAIDTAPDDVLDLLAIELNTQYYDSSLAIGAKRKLIKNTMVWYMGGGTPQAVEELVAAVFGEGNVSEWFEYGDEPYFFKITTNARMTPEMNAQFSAMLAKVKNARSHIRAIEIHRMAEQTFYSGACVLAEYNPPSIIDGYWVEREICESVYAGIADGAQTRPEAILDGFSAEGDIITGSICFGLAAAATARNPAIMENLKDHADVVAVLYCSGLVASVPVVKPPAIREGFSDAAEKVTESRFSGTAQFVHQKPSAIIDGFTEMAKAVKQANTVAAAADSRYKNIIR